jgi:hypothetical protein
VIRRAIWVQAEPGSAAPGGRPAGSETLGTIVAGVTDDQPTTQELRRRQQDQERTEREQVAESDTDADADRHRRRAEKAGYLRRKLQEREQSEGT